MKKTLSLLAVAAIAGTAFAAANDALISFSTVGEGYDTYADGTKVLDGECYALVWTAKGSAGLTLAADGTAEGGEIVLAAPVAKDGHCPRIVFEVDADDMAAKYKGGTWSVYLLDTRRWGADGVARPAGTVSGKVRLVNAAAPVAAKVGVSTASSVETAVASGTVASVATAVPAGAPAPEITGIRVDGANVFVTVRGTVPYLQYGLAEGKTPDAVSTAVDSAPQTGAAAADEEIVLVAPVKKGSSFFKVGRK